MHTIPHGGRLLAARRRFPGAPAPFLDLSTGISPLPYPFTPPSREAWTRLPEPEAVLALEAAAAAAYGVADPAMVVAAPGTQALIQLLPRLLPQPHIAIPGPTYAEHEAAWRAGGATVVRTPVLTGRAAVLCNPNNPDGARHDPAVLAAAAVRMDLLVVDEAFADFEPGLSLADRLPLPGVILLRSFGKSYGLAGVRLGFALTEPALAARLRAALGPWAVAGPAIEIGTQALSDLAWRAAAAAAAHSGAVALDALLSGAGLRVRGGTALFRLAECAGAPGVAERLGEAGILVRSFPEQPGWLRFGLPDGPVASARLAAALGAATPCPAAVL